MSAASSRCMEGADVSHIIFYEKPGCGGNARQKAQLLQAGHTLEVRDLLSQPWTRATLLAFLDPLPVADWFNLSAPRVKCGEIDPRTLDREQALALLLAEPLLIRRPLLQAGELRMVGFAPQALQRLLAGQTPHGQDSARGALEGCPRSQHDAPPPGACRP